MTLPIRCVDRGVFNGITAVDHLTVSGIDSYVRYRVTGIVCSREENDVSGSCLRCADMLALIVYALRRCPRQVVITAVSHHIAHKARTVETR